MVQINANSISTLTLIVVMAKCAQSLKITKFWVPSEASAGDSVTLVCDYDQETDTVKVVQWDYNKTTFYRYMPTNGTGYEIFPLPADLKLNEHKSNGTRLVLDNVSPDISGSYSCELIIEHPNNYVTGLGLFQSNFLQVNGASQFAFSAKTLSAMAIISLVAHILSS